MKVIWHPAALADRDVMISYIEERNPLAALEMLEALVLAADSLAVFPLRGRLGSAADTRELTAIPPYILVYEVREGEIHILRIWHGAQNR